MSKNIEKHDEPDIWYEYLKSLYSKFSEYALQKDRSSLGKKFIKWIDGRDLDPNANEEFKIFLNETAGYKILGHDSVRRMTLTMKQLIELQIILKLSLSIDTSESSESEFFVKGDFVKLSDFLETDKHFRMNPKNITIFATNTVFIDKNISGEGKELNVVIMAPKWEVIGSHWINLNGQNTLDEMPTAGENENGKPGLPGGPAGNFFGVAERVISAANLKITADGGVGGIGQDGGEGGLYPMLTYGKSNKPVGGVICKSKLNMDDHTMESFFNGEGLPISFKYEVYNDSVTDTLVYRLFGKEQSDNPFASPPGMGGRGGSGGQPGEIHLFSLKNNSIEFYEPKLGRIGINGKKGAGGTEHRYLEVHRLNPHKSARPKCEYGSTEMFRNPSNRDPPENFHSFFEKQYGNGNVTIYPVNTEGVIEPRKARKSDAVHNINKYKAHLREILADHPNKESLLEFLMTVDGHGAINKLYDVYSLIEDFKVLEEQYFFLNEKLNFVQFYQSLLGRIGEYIENSKEIKAREDYKEILRYLYTALLIKIRNLSDHSNTNLILHAYELLEFVEKDMRKLEKLQVEQSTIKAMYATVKGIEHYRSGYTGNLQKKIEETKSFVEEIDSELQIIINGIDNDIQGLLEQIKDEREKTEKQIIELKRQMQLKLIVKAVFGVLKVIGTIAKFFGPVGMAINGAVQGMSAVFEPLALNAIGSKPTLSDNEKALSAVINKNIPFMKDEMTAHLKKCLALFDKESQKFPKELNDMVPEMYDIKKKLKNPSLDPEILQKLNKKFKDKIDEKVKQMQSMKYIDSQKFKDLKESVEKLQKGYQVSTAVVDTYQSIIEIKKEYDDAIAEVDEYLVGLGRLETHVQYILAPTFKRVEDDMNKIKNNLGGKSRVALDITKWNVKRALGEILKHLRENLEPIKKKFPQIAKLDESIEKLEDSMAMLISMYEHIENYQEQKHLADYIADIVVAESRPKVQSTFTTLKNQLDVTISSNLILNQYEIAVDAVKQYAFPYIRKIIRNDDSPLSLIEGKNFPKTVESAVNKIEQLKRGFDEYKTQANKYDNCIIVPVGSDHASTMKTYFTWTNKKHKDMISKLLSGGEVTVEADVRHSSMDYHAIKFREAYLEFRAKNQSIQQEINKAIEKFMIHMTHLGNSHYRFEENFYEIVTPSILLTYRLEAESNGQKPIEANVHYGNLKKTDFLLSPYATWKIHLNPLSNGYVEGNLEYQYSEENGASDMITANEDPYSEIKKYAKDIDLILKGRGSHVSRRHNIKDENSEGGQRPGDCGKCDPTLEVDKYYRPYNESERVTNTKNRVSFTCPEFNSGFRSRRDLTKVIKNNVDDESNESTDKLATNSASSFISSPINDLCTWFKSRHIALVSSSSAALYFLTESIQKILFRGYQEYQDDVGVSPTEEIMFDSIEEDEIYYDASENIHEAPKVKLIERNAVRNQRLFFEMYTNNTNSHYDNSIGWIATDNFDRSKMHSTPRANADFSHLQNFQGRGLLMLADILVRSFNGEKYQHSAFITPEQQKALYINDIKQLVLTPMQGGINIFGPRYEAS